MAFLFSNSSIHRIQALKWTVQAVCSRIFLSIRSYSPRCSTISSYALHALTRLLTWILFSKVIGANMRLIQQITRLRRQLTETQNFQLSDSFASKARSILRSSSYSSAKKNKTRKISAHSSIKPATVMKIENIELTDKAMAVISQKQN